MNFLFDPQDERSTFRPTDVMVDGGKRETCKVDLIGISPVLGLGIRAFMVGQTALKVASSRLVKCEKTRYGNQRTFIVLVFDIFGFLTS